MGGIMDVPNNQGLHVLPQRSGSFGNSMNKNGMLPVSHSRQGNHFRHGQPASGLSGAAGGSN